MDKEFLCANIERWPNEAVLRVRLYEQSGSVHLILTRDMARRCFAVGGRYRLTIEEVDPGFPVLADAVERYEEHLLGAYGAT